MEYRYICGIKNFTKPFFHYTFVASFLCFQFLTLLATFQHRTDFFLKKVRINFLKPLLRSDMKQYHQINGKRVQKIFKGCYFKMFLPPSLFAIRLNQLFSIFLSPHYWPLRLALGLDVTLPVTKHPQL